MNPKGIEIKNEMRRALAACKMEMAGSGISPDGWETIIDNIKALCRNWAEAEALAHVMGEYIESAVAPVTEGVVEYFKTRDAYRERMREIYPEEFYDD